MGSRPLGLMVWLTSNLRHLGNTPRDVPTLLFGALCTLLGYQILWLRIYAEVHGWASGLIPSRTFAARTVCRFSLEYGLCAGAILGLIGLGQSLQLSGERFKPEPGARGMEVTLHWAL